LERAEYKGAGLDKFEAQNGKLWNSSIVTVNTVIYQVKPMEFLMIRSAKSPDFAMIL